MERGFDDDDEFDGGEVIAIGDPEVSILPAEKNANQVLAEIILDGRIKLGTRNSYNKIQPHACVLPYGSRCLTWTFDVCTPHRTTVQRGY